jgi:hypothetical protein
MPDEDGNTKADEETLPDTTLHADKHADGESEASHDKDDADSDGEATDEDSGGEREARSQNEQGSDEAPGLGSAAGATGGPDDVSPEDADPPSGPEKSSLP